MKNIFVISGGGVRGIIPAKALTQLKTEKPEVKPDLIIGTSVGAILGAYLALGLDGDLCKVFRDSAGEIFKKKKLLPPKYNLDNAVKYLDDVIFKGKTCGDFKVPLIVSSSELAGETTMYFNSDKPWLKDKSVGYFISPSFAAPLYFKHIPIKEKKHILSDGGVGYNNFAIMPAFIEAAKRGFLGKEECCFYAFGTGVEKCNKEEKYEKLVKKKWLGDVLEYLSVKSGGFARKSSFNEQINAGYNIAKNVAGVSFVYYDAYVDKNYNLDDVKAIVEMEKLKIEIMKEVG
ncbi:MAG: patatin-like phospholipase family protein [Chitinivibrionia bacterium]|nr:patatin-like phospholipase family protein [Chitinivibrionia bacterium]